MAKSSDGSVKLHITGQDPSVSGEASISRATFSVAIKRSHEKFLPPDMDFKVTMTASQLSTVYESWATFLSGDSSAYHAQLDEDNTDKVQSPVTFFYDTFYSRLFTLAPSMRSVFGDNMVRQSRCLVRMICECAGMHEAFAANKGLSGAQTVAQANAELGIRSEHYAPIASALKYSLAYCFGEGGMYGWTAALSEAWTGAIALFIAACTSTTIAALEEAEPKQSESEQWAALQKY
ncbi:hypothetical protein JKP88DRAFT_296374, partial [Tribonema minus]